MLAEASRTSISHGCGFLFTKQLNVRTRNQAVARITDRTAS